MIISKILIQSCGVCILGLSLVLCSAATSASTVTVKYIGDVSLDGFDCTPTPKSSFIRSICADRKSGRVLTKLGSTWYQYCLVPNKVVDLWLRQDSLGRYYNQNIKSQFSCQ